MVFLPPEQMLFSAGRTVSIPSPGMRSNIRLLHTAQAFCSGDAGQQNKQKASRDVITKSWRS